MSSASVSRDLGRLGSRPATPIPDSNPANEIPSFRELAHGREDVECRRVESRESQALR